LSGSAIGCAFAEEKQESRAMNIASIRSEWFLFMSYSICLQEGRGAKAPPTFIIIESLLHSLLPVLVRVRVRYWLGTAWGRRVSKRSSNVFP
jgi:hypothetical protein